MAIRASASVGTTSGCNRGSLIMDVGTLLSEGFRTQSPRRFNSISSAWRPPADRARQASARSPSDKLLMSFDDAGPLASAAAAAYP
jgi:hypothetical protein